MLTSAAIQCSGKGGAIGDDAFGELPTTPHILNDRSVSILPLLSLYYSNLLSSGKACFGHVEG